jgi:hypothetical protein
MEYDHLEMEFDIRFHRNGIWMNIDMFIEKCTEIQMIPMIFAPFASCSDCCCEACEQRQLDRLDRGGEHSVDQ